ncbi:MAG: DUF4365 domain-containing protein, partial [Phototrophicaceae bacterium]
MSNTEDLGISAIHHIIAEMGFFWRELSKHDFGIDAHVELPSGNPQVGNGKILAFQIKSGESYIQFDSENNLFFYADSRHYEYWKHYALPVIFAVYSPEQKIVWWIDLSRYIDENPFDRTKKNFTIRIPKNQILSIRSEGDFRAIAG